MTQNINHYPKPGSSKTKIAYIETYGCAANQADSEIMGGLLVKNSLQLSNSPEKSDTLIINTCDVKSATEQKILHRIRFLKEKFPEKKLVIAGCMAENRAPKLLKIAPTSSIVGTRRITEIFDALGEQVVLTGNNGTGINGTELKNINKINLPRVRINPVISIVQISEGCNDFCTFCSTKLAKGNIVSYSQQRIIREVQSSMQDGCKEIQLTSQDTGAYGFDREKKCKLPELLRSISKIELNNKTSEAREAKGIANAKPMDKTSEAREPIFKVRVGMLNPNNIIDVLDDLVRAYNSDRIYKFLHVPVQSGDNTILKRMARRYTVEQYLEILGEFRKSYQKIQIWTDIIVGFPGETEEQFKNTLSIIKKSKPDFINISRYAKRDGTAAARLRQLPTDLVKERTRELSKLADQIALEINKTWIGWEGPVLVTERGKKENQWLGKNYAYKPVIIESKESLLGKTMNVKVAGALPAALLT